VPPDSEGCEKSQVFDGELEPKEYPPALNHCTSIGYRAERSMRAGRKIDISESHMSLTVPTGRKTDPVAPQSGQLYTGTGGSEASALTRSAN
jgi:hypothetical protein